MTTRRKPPKAPPPSPEEDAAPLPAPPSWGGPAVPEPIHDSERPTEPYGVPPTEPRPTSTPIVLHDEKAFMQECADRLNAFIHTYPDEAQHVLATYVTYEHELVAVHEHATRHKIHKSKPPGVTIAALFAALLQTHRGNGFFIRPLVVPDPDAGVGCSRIVKFNVVEQDDGEDDGPSA